MAVYMSLEKRIRDDPGEVIDAFLTDRLRTELLIGGHSDLLDEFKRQTAAKRRPKDASMRPIRLHLLNRSDEQAEGEADLGEDGGVERGGPQFLADWEASPEDQLISKETMRDCLIALTAQEELVVGFLEQGFRSWEVAEKMGVSESRVSAIKSAAKRKIASVLNSGVAKPLPKPKQP